MCGEMLSVSGGGLAHRHFLSPYSRLLSSSKALLCITLCSLTLSRRFISDTPIVEKDTPRGRRSTHYQLFVDVNCLNIGPLPVYTTSYYCTFCVCFFSFDKGEKKGSKKGHTKESETMKMLKEILEREKSLTTSSAVTDNVQSKS